MLLAKQWIRLVEVLGVQDGTRNNSDINPEARARTAESFFAANEVDRHA